MLQAIQYSITNFWVHFQGIFLHSLFSITGVAHTLDHAVGLLGVLAKAIDI